MLVSLLWEGVLGFTTCSTLSPDFEDGRVFSSAEGSDCSLWNELLPARKRDQLPEIRHNTLGK